MARLTCTAYLAYEHAVHTTAAKTPIPRHLRSWNPPRGAPLLPVRVHLDRCVVKYLMSCHSGGTEGDL